MCWEAKNTKFQTPQTLGRCCQCPIFVGVFCLLRASSSSSFSCETLSQPPPELTDPFQPVYIPDLGMASVSFFRFAFGRIGWKWLWTAVVVGMFCGEWLWAVLQVVVEETLDFWMSLFGYAT